MAPMNGTSATTGKLLGGIAHLRQSITDILRTPIGSRVMRRDYGSRVFSLIDAPLNRVTIADLYAAVADALQRWEPRLRLTAVVASSAEVGQVVLDITGDYLPDGTSVTLDGIVVN